jgi:hypothetical protein
VLTGPLGDRAPAVPQRQGTGLEQADEPPTKHLRVVFEKPIIG